MSNHMCDMKPAETEDEDPPDAIASNGTKLWHDANGQLHRLNAPAVFRPGFQHWYEHGERHRLDGPAYIREGLERWWIMGKEITDQVEEWMERLAIKPWQEWGEFERMLFKISFGG
jgi:hypothetical protein